MPRKSHLHLYALALALSAFLRHMMQLGREWDWADLQQALNVQALLDHGGLGGASVHGGVLSQGPLFSALLAPFYALIGSVAGPFVGMNVLALLSAILCFELARRFINYRAAWLCLLLMCLTPWAVALGTDISNNEACVPFVVLAALGCLSFARKPSWKSWVLLLAALTLTWQVALSGMLAIAGMLIGLLIGRRKLFGPAHIVAAVAVLALNIELSLLWPAAEASGGWSLTLQQPGPNLVELSRRSGGMAFLGLMLAIWAVWTGRPRAGRSNPLLLILGMWVLLPLCYVIFFEPPQRVHYLFASLPGAMLLLGLLLGEAWAAIPGATKGMLWVLRGSQIAGIAMLTAANLVMPSIGGAIGLHAIPPQSMLERSDLLHQIEINLGPDALSDLDSAPALRGWGSYNQARFLQRSLALRNEPLAAATEPCNLVLDKRGADDALHYGCAGDPVRDLPRSVALDPCVELEVGRSDGAVLEIIVPSLEAEALSARLDSQPLSLVQYESDEQFIQLYALLESAGAQSRIEICSSAGRPLRVRVDLFVTER
ncbi:MAG: glycosyltransferase family 39 protein [Candidatus Alcyoniella australis]|nr:glycosyltransferase family 39 protein [Candidatus Alcyoniella australis]